MTNILTRGAWLGALSSALLLCACEHADPLEPGDFAPTLASVQENIFNRNCALSGCHAGPGAQQGLDLSEGRARDNLVNVPSNEVPSLLRVSPGNPDASYVVMKIEGASGIQGQRMPLGGTPLTSAEIALVRDWIEAGANP